MRARHILIKLGANASEADKTEGRSRLGEIRERAEAGEDFAALAQAHSEDGSAARGGRTVTVGARPVAAA